MVKYSNLNGTSSITAYEISKNSIIVEFDSKVRYEYTQQSVGPTYLTHMKSLALKGQGLNAFINQKTKYKYARKI